MNGIACRLPISTQYEQIDVVADTFPVHYSPIRLVRQARGSSTQQINADIVHGNAISEYSGKRIGLLPREF